MSPLGSDGLPAGEKKVEGAPVLSRAQRRKQVSQGEGVSLIDGSDSPVGSTPVAFIEGEQGEETEGAGFDIMSLPAPLADPDAYNEDISGVESNPDIEPVAEDDKSLIVAESDAEETDGDGETSVGWDIIFPEGENPRILIRAALLTDGTEVSSDEDSIPVVESSVELSDEDVDRLMKLAHKVEKHHSRSAKFGRRLFKWAMRRKFFAGVTFAILMYLVISEVVRAFI